MRTSDNLDQIGPALAKAQGAIEPALKDRVNPAFRSKYADLTSVWTAARNACSENGISVLQEVTGWEHGVCITTRLQHASGQWIELGPTPIPVSKQDAQGYGSATSYGRRYGLAAALGVVADEDDDGNAAASARPQPARPQAKPHAMVVADFDAALEACATVSAVAELKARARPAFEAAADREGYERFVDRAKKRAATINQGTAAA